ncbi:M3 family oligoendopeptidase [Alicyclobacillus contaminans]|uniref:M3 family oligoendopeptidase n=1 Tax=Alicyclobacillus contaminans TaxID=392016 RepID=UPI000478B36B|nr:M3 family oligoendopeptidase [Alicyclobacillus contaminans]
MTFQEMTYERPDFDQLKAAFDAGLAEFNAAATAEAQNAALKRLIDLREHFDSMYQLVYIRHSVNTKDEFYAAEQDYFDETMPKYQALVADLYKAMLASRFRQELEVKWGSQLFALAECTVRSFSPEIVADLQEENKRVSDYVKLIASAEIPFEGETRTLPQLQPFELSPDRDMRKRAADARWSFFAEHEDTIDQIYSDLVAIRTRMARKLGFSNYAEMSYLLMNRTDYNADMVAAFRKQVREVLVPVATRLREKQRRRIGVDTLRYYDDGFMFKSGNATPKGDPQWIVENGRRMYEALSPETAEFFHFMQENQLLDLVSKPGKASGGYCTYIPEFKSPFIFSNFNGTAGDIDVLTHEAGHAFQVYLSRGYEVPEYHFPTYEACEIHSMSMEFFTWPWMQQFFQDETEKYHYAHLTDAVFFIPYGVAVDEFQHIVYQNPDMTPAERKQVWRDLEKVYLPHRNYEGNAFLERGGYWFRQQHIFTSPFYYIDYTLAQICALQFWKKMHEDRDSAWADYLRLCKLGGSQSFLRLVEEARLVSPFDEGCVASVVGHIEQWLNQVDDARL